MASRRVTGAAIALGRGQSRLPVPGPGPLDPHAATSSLLEAEEGQGPGVPASPLHAGQLSTEPSPRLHAVHPVAWLSLSS